MYLKSLTFVMAASLVSVSALAQESWGGLNGPAPAAAQAADGLFPLKERADAGLARQGPAPIAPVREASLPRSPAAKSPAPVDESALRYYASRNDTARVAAEIRRIRMLNPDWIPPQDLFEGSMDSSEEQKLWDLYREGRLDEIPAAVEQIQQRLPNWSPSAEFVSKFEQALARREIIEASNSGDSARVIALAEARPALMVCTEMDALWRVAEALAKTEAHHKAFDLYRFILTHCSVPQERLATVQKASALLPPSMAEKLLATGPRTGERSVFENVRLDLLRRRIGEAINGGADVNPTELNGFERLAEQRRSADDAMLLGWLHYAKKDATGAARWFKMAMGFGNSPKAIEGYALSLREQGQLSEAEKVAFDSRQADPLIAQLYVEILATEITKDPAPQVDPTRLSRLEGVVDETKSVTGSQALGWYYYKRGTTDAALQWFKRSMAWEPVEANVLGYALSAHKLRDTAGFKAAVVEYGSRFPAVAALKGLDVVTKRRAVARHSGAAGGRLAREAVSLYQAGKHSEALAVLDKRAATAKEDHGLALLRGWSLYHTGQWAKAKEHFEALDAQHSTRDTQYGKFYANERLIDPRFRAN